LYGACALPKEKKMWRKITIALLISSVFLSCSRNANDVKADDTSSQASSGLAYQTEEERIRDLLHTQADRATEYNERVLSLNKVNFGIPGGDNWLVEWSNNYTDEYTLLLLYVIKDDFLLNITI
jgi:hypothetical protein